MSYELNYELRTKNSVLKKAIKWLARKSESSILLFNLW